MLSHYSQIPSYRESILRWQLPRHDSLYHQLIELVPFSETRLRELVELGSVYINEKRLLNFAEAQARFAADTKIRIHSEPRRCLVTNIDWDARISFETNSFLVIDKPAGLPAHPMVDNWQENALVQLEKFKKCKLFLTHRLDRPTEGLMLIAKTAEFQREFNRMLLHSEIHKYYRAEVESSLPSNTPRELLHWMKPSLAAPKKLLSEAPLDKTIKVEECRLEIRSENKNSLIIKLLTGRTHQIRAQLSFIGSPIVGDQLYGAAKPLSEDQIRLQSAALNFIDPLSKKKLELNLPPPTWFRRPDSKFF